jgi:hypothetical protein
MRSTTLATLALAFAVTGCGLFHRSSKSTTLDPGLANVRYQWRGSLFTPAALAGAMQVRGTATWSADGDAASTVVLSISNATPGGIHPWHIHRGHCGDNGPIVGDASAYKPLAVDEKGNASANARLNVPLPTSGDYYVNVHALASNMGTIISCGNLAKPIS